MPQSGSVRAVDHLVLPVQRLATARSRLEALGFTVAADARHPFGTENACVFLADGTYIEPLAVGDRVEYEAASSSGNVFTAHHRGFCSRNGNEGFSAIVISTTDAIADDTRLRALGLSAGEMLEFSRPMKLPDGGESVASFRLAFAADPQAEDFLMFACERINPLPASRGALEVHANGVTALSAIVLEAETPAAYAAMFSGFFMQPDMVVNSAGISLGAANAGIEVLTPEALSAHYATDGETAGRGLQGRAVVFRVADLAVTGSLLAANGIAYHRISERLIVPPAPGQGAIFVFEGKSGA